MSEIIGRLAAEDSLSAVLSTEDSLFATVSIAGEPIYTHQESIDNFTIKRNASGQLYVNVVNELNDMTLPITSAAVNVTVGNINSILTTI